MPTNPTDADRETARECLGPWMVPGEVVVAIAQALAAERERARAPFLALADWLERTGAVRDFGLSRYDAATRIRTAAQEPTP